MTLFIICILIGAGFVLWHLYQKHLDKKYKKNGSLLIHRNFPNFDYKELDDMPLAGHWHYKKGSIYLRANDWLALKRDRNNEYDRDAIQVWDLYNHMVGHIPAERNKGLAKAIDNGDTFFAIVRKIIGSGEYRDIILTLCKVEP